MYSSWTLWGPKLNPIFLLFARTLCIYPATVEPSKWFAVKQSHIVSSYFRWVCKCEMDFLVFSTSILESPYHFMKHWTLNERRHWVVNSNKVCHISYRLRPFVRAYVFDYGRTASYRKHTGNISCVVKLIASQRSIYKDSNGFTVNTN